ncbi:glutamate synthase large subunit [Oligoflexus tunisiensis]|uniref:glutamate synthase large subunit n=1 Tax=Oligoflexus tunisiensis TaxID=708132 RepID=UPI00114D058F|nr:glutamate synthase large subunit [Oligoflexus tunisiensis]
MVQRDACGVGFIASIKGHKSHKIVTEGLEILRRMDHRGGRAADDLTSDGAGLLTQIPHELFQAIAREAGKALPAPGAYAVGFFFLPKEQDEQQHWAGRMDALTAKWELVPLIQRAVPVDNRVLGPIAAGNEPAITQWVFTDANTKAASPFTWRLYMLRKELEEEGRARYGIKQLRFYCVSLSTETICYKGLILAKDLAHYYLDLQDERFTAAFAMVHQRFSTNTMPSWPLAQPFRTICHNGEINTLRGNINAMHARSKLLKKAGLEADLAAMGPICTPGLSDSAMLDNTIEFLVNTGRPLPQVLTMLIPEPWDSHTEMEQALKDYYEYHSYLMEPWDGPAFIGFADGHRIGAILDRNGLRPGRYWVTLDGYVIMASEAGVLDRRPEEIVHKGRLSPGRMFLVDMKQGTIVPDHTIKQSLASQKPYGKWLQAHRRHLYELPVPNFAAYPAEDESALQQKLLAFGYTKEDLRMILAPMANEGKEPVGSMGNDAPIAVLSQQRPLLYNYFKQLFAQVTNPPIDAIREEMVTSLASHLGGESNLIDETPEHCHMLRLKQPILSDLDLQRLEFHGDARLMARKISTLYEPAQETLEAAVARVQETVATAIAEGCSVIILSDREVDAQRAPIPALLATAAVHHDLIRRGLRMKASLVVESGEPREVHHFALLMGYGAAAVNPWLALAVIAQRAETHGFDPNKTAATLQGNFIKSLGDGLLKIMSKMGISTLQSYRGAQIFEALGLNQAFIDEYFTWTPTRIEGAGIADFDADTRFRHQKAYGPRTVFSALPQGGQYHWRRDGEAHLHHPAMIAGLQQATRINSREEFKKFCATLDAQSQQYLNIRGLLKFKKVQNPVPLDEVEPAASIVKRFATGAMSFGSISKETHETIAIAMNRIGARSNSGEGGEDADRFIPAANGDLRRSSIKQVASARFGVTSHYLINADELQIKIAQGAKPGEGGQLPGHKVDEEIARVRHSTPGITLISPPPHHDIYSIEDLAQLIFDLKNANRDARVSVKLVSEVGVGTVAAGVAKAKADVILIAGYEGGTGASPISSIKHAGLPWELGLAESHRTLVENQLRGRVVLQADGQMRTPRDLAIAALLGAEEWGIGTGALIVLGCIMMRKCHLNTCPVGIATQDPELRRKFHGQPEHLINYFFLLAEGLREIMAELGFRSVAEMVGRVDLLEKIADPRTDRIDLRAILDAPAAPMEAPRCNTTRQNHEMERTLDYRVLLSACEPALMQRHPVQLDLQVANTDRAVGTMLSSEISRQHGGYGLRDNSIYLNCKGSAGQSFMAFGAKGITAVLEGEVNDYCGKGLSGAKVVVVPPEESAIMAESNVICGNVTLYGATSGFLYIRGLAGERFAVRNSGAHAVVEGLGDHGCEYMTGGSVIVLGRVGRNFAAGMSGGYAFLYDADGASQKRINTEMVEVSPLQDEEDESFVHRQLQEHLRLTRSSVAAHILENWNQEKSRFLSIVPSAYRAFVRHQQRDHVQPSMRVVGGDNLRAILEEGAYHG